MTLELQIWSDYACPYCYIGKAHLDQALTEFEDSDDVKITFRTFELDPSAGPNVTTTTQGRIEQKYRKYSASAQDMINGIKRFGAKSGLNMAYDQVRYTNTFDAHRLTKYAADSGLETPMAMRLFEAYFTDLLELSDHEVLATLASEVGLDKKSVAEMLKSDQYKKECRNDEATAHSLGIQAVPAFHFDGHATLTGAQPASALLKALREAWEQQQSEPSEEALMCTPDGCTPAPQK